jgi:hypothetical protein
MRISSLLLLAALAACGEEQQEAARAQEQREVAAAPHFPCAKDDAPLRPDCTAERMQTKDGWVITIRHPDGHFRRLRVTDDGRGVVAADGAEPARTTPAGADSVDIAIAGDRYRLPATVGR